MRKMNTLEEQNLLNVIDRNVEENNREMRRFSEIMEFCLKSHDLSENDEYENNLELFMNRIMKFLLILADEYNWLSSQRSDLMFDKSLQNNSEDSDGLNYGK